MNTTLYWNSTEEVIGYLLLAAISMSLHGYALFLCSAISDYQDEKPFQEKSPFDILIKGSFFSKTNSVVIFNILKIR